MSTSAHRRPVAESKTGALRPLVPSAGSPLIQFDTLRIDSRADAFSAMILFLFVSIARPRAARAK